MTYLNANTHDFKTNIAKYIRQLELGLHKGIILKRYDKPVGIFMLLPEAAAAPGQETKKDA